MRRKRSRPSSLQHGIYHTLSVTLSSTPSQTPHAALDTHTEQREAACAKTRVLQDELTHTAHHVRAGADPAQRQRVHCLRGREILAQHGRIR